MSGSTLSALKSKRGVDCPFWKRQNASLLRSSSASGSFCMISSTWVCRCGRALDTGGGRLGGGSTPKLSNFRYIIFLARHCFVRLGGLGISRAQPLRGSEADSLEQYHHRAFVTNLYDH